MVKLRVLRVGEQLPDLGDAARAVHLGHRVVHHDQLVEGHLVETRQSCLHDGDRILAAVGQVRSLVELLQEALKGEDVEVVIIHD